MTDTKALTKCLQRQVFPHLDRALNSLKKNVYDVDKLGGKIINKVTSGDFEYHFRNGNGRLPLDVEASVIRRIYDLLDEFTKGNVGFCFLCELRSSLTYLGIPTPPPFAQASTTSAHTKTYPAAPYFDFTFHRGFNEHAIA